MEAAQLEEIEKAGRKGTFVFKHVMGKANYADVLCDFAYEKQADVLVVGHGGQSAKKRPPRAGERHPRPLPDDLPRWAASITPWVCVLQTALASLCARRPGRGSAP